MNLTAIRSTRNWSLTRDRRALPIVVSTTPSENELHELREKLIEYNTSCVGNANYTPLLLTLVDDRGSLIGGLAGSIYYNWLFIELLWVAEQMRGRGQGRALLQKAEEEARLRGCQHSWLDTFSFQARGFYERNGYTLFGELSDYPSGHQRYFLRKPLTL